MPDENGLSSHVDYTFGFDHTARLREIFERAELRHSAFVQIIEAAYTWRIRALIEERGEGNAPEGSYPYIAISVDNFIDLLVDLRALLLKDPAHADGEGGIRPISFLEPGCGPGRNIDFLRWSGMFDLSRFGGFDILPDYVDVGREFLDLGDRLWVADAMTFDYGGWNVIYSYRPFSDDAAEAAYERHVVDTADPGTYFLMPLREGIEEFPEIEVMDYSQQILRKRHPGE